MNGLTRERNSRPRELGPNQTSCRQNWAVGFFNPVGGYTVGKVWAPVSTSTGDPDTSVLPFSEGSVVAKLLYTEATTSEVSLLAGAPEVDANIAVRASAADPQCPPDTAPRSPGKLRLLQLDVAVKDSRAGFTGWVFGTFVYDGRLSGSDPWAKLKPVGLMWGNDPGLSDSAAQSGVKPSESIVLSNFGLGRDFGRGGRMNGPVDNSVSACMSCHMTSQWPNPAPMTPGAAMPWDQAKCWFRNLGPSDPFGDTPSGAGGCGSLPNPAPAALDFSLQLAVGIRNYKSEPRPIVTSFSLEQLNASRAASSKTFSVNGVNSLPISREGAE